MMISAILASSLKSLTSTAFILSLKVYVQDDEDKILFANHGAALIWADLFAAYVMWMMMIYLTDVWKLNYTHAAAIINIWMGSVLVLPTPFVHLADAFIGNFGLLLLSSLSYVVGLGLLWMSTPPVLANSYGNCKAYKPECIGDHQKVLLYTGLVLSAVGMAGHLTSHGSFAEEQTNNEETPTPVDGQSDDDIVTMLPIDVENVGCMACCGFCLGSFAIVLVPIAGLIVVGVVKPWATRFGVCALFTLIATLVFLSGVCSYKYGRPVGSPITTMFRVFLASFSKIIYRRPRDLKELYEKDGVGVNDSLPHTKGLRCLDKAAIVLPNQSLEQQQQNRWRLCSVTEVEETKIVIRMIPMWLTFILCGLVSSIGNTYFLEQASHLDRKVGKIKVPLILFLWFYDQGKQLFSKIYIFISNAFTSSSSESNKVKKRFVSPIGVGVAMIFSILCCITAAKVEARRLGVVQSHGLVEKPDEKIPMSIFWLLPQFVLLGALDGIYHISVACFFGDQVPPSMVRYMLIFSEAVFGTGIMGSAISVYVVGKISKRGGKKNWFQSTLNKSRLDNYYWVLAALSAANLVLYVIIAIFYRYRNANEEELEDSEYDPGDDCLDGVKCCC